MKNSNYKVKILLVGPENAGKTRIANFLADSMVELPEDFQQTSTLRILEYDVIEADINGTKSDVDVQLWDTSGNQSTIQYWPVFRKNANGIVFVWTDDDTSNNVKQLEDMYNYFVTQHNFNLRGCLVCCMPSELGSSTLPQTFAKVSKINVNLESNAQKFKQEFNKYVASVVVSAIN